MPKKITTKSQREPFLNACYQTKCHFKIYQFCYNFDSWPVVLIYTLNKTDYIFLNLFRIFREIHLVLSGICTVTFYQFYFDTKLHHVNIFTLITFTSVAFSANSQLDIELYNTRLVLFNNTAVLMFPVVFILNNIFPLVTAEFFPLVKQSHKTFFIDFFGNSIRSCQTGPSNCHKISHHILKVPRKDFKSHSQNLDVHLYILQSTCQ